MGLIICAVRGTSYNVSDLDSDVIVSEGVIVSPKKPAEQVKFRWDPDLVVQLKELADRTHRTINETGELLIRWAIERSKEELDRAELEPGTPLKRKK